MDLLDSFKGAGVIGTFLGAFVLIGFVIMSFLVFDPRFVDPFTSEAGIVRAQDQEIVRLEGELERLRERVSAHEERRKAADELEAMLEQNRDGTAAVKAVVGEIARVKQELGKIEAADREYRKDYRAMLRSNAAGETMVELVTEEGKVMQDVVVLSVSPVGLHVRHRDGTARIAFTNLPEGIRQRFQFELEEMEAYLEEEGRENRSHERMIDAGLSQVLAERKAARIEFLRKRIPLLRERVALRSKRLESGERFSSQFEFWRLQELEASDREELQRIVPEYERLVADETGSQGKR